MSYTDKSAGRRTAQLQCRACPAPRSTPAPAPTPPTAWSQYPATQNVDMSCNLITDVSGITFCDGITYMGPGGSFDISLRLLEHLQILLFRQICMHL
jgi:hypothetical protein